MMYCLFHAGAYARTMLVTKIAHCNEFYYAREPNLR